MPRSGTGTSAVQGGVRAKLTHAILTRYEKRFLRWDLVLVTFVGVALVAGVRTFFGEFAVGPAETRRQLYVTGAGIAAALTGFGLVAITLMLDLTASPSVAVLKKSEHFPLLFATFLSTTRYMSLTMIVLVAAIVADSNPEMPWWLLIVVVLSALISAARFARCLWIIARILGIVTKGSAESNLAPNSR